MNSKCMNCLVDIRDQDKFTFEISDLGYGSCFDGMEGKVVLCDKCYQDSNINWSQEKVVVHQGDNFQLFQLKYEDDIFRYIDNFSQEGKDIFNENSKNRFGGCL